MVVNVVVVGAGVGAGVLSVVSVVAVVTVVAVGVVVVSVVVVAVVSVVVGAAVGAAVDFGDLLPSLAAFDVVVTVVAVVVVVIVVVATFGFLKTHFGPDPTPGRQVPSFSCTYMSPFTGSLFAYQEYFLQSQVFRFLPPYPAQLLPVHLYAH